VRGVKPTGSAKVAITLIPGVMPSVAVEATGGGAGGGSGGGSLEHAAATKVAASASTMKTDLLIKNR